MHLKCDSIVTHARASCSLSRALSVQQLYTTRMKECSTLNIADKNNNRRETQIKNTNILSTIQKVLQMRENALWLRSNLPFGNPNPWIKKQDAVLKNIYL